MRSCVSGAGERRVASMRPSCWRERSAVQPLKTVFVPRSQSNNALNGMAAPVLFSISSSVELKFLISSPVASVAWPGDQRIKPSVLPIGLVKLNSPCWALPRSSKPAKNACAGSVRICRLSRPAQTSVWFCLFIEVSVLAQPLRIKALAAKPVNASVRRDKNSWLKALPLSALEFPPRFRCRG